MASQRVRHNLATEQQHNIELEGSSLVRQSGLPKAECLLMLCVRVQSSFLSFIFSAQIAKKQTLVLILIISELQGQLDLWPFIYFIYIKTKLLTWTKMVEIVETLDNTKDPKFCSY